LILRTQINIRDTASQGIPWHDIYAARDNKMNIIREAYIMMINKKNK